VTGVIAVAGGGAHSLALRSGPPELTVWAWGSNEYDQVGAFNWEPCNPGSGAPSFGCQSYQRQVAGLTDVIDIAAGEGHSVVLKVDGTVWTWGSDWRGQLGVPGFSAYTSSTPIQVAIASDTPPYVVSPLSSVTSIAAGSQHSLALKSDGTVWAWGSNEFGQVGGGNSPVRSERVTQVRGPGDVGFLTGVTDIAAGGNHTLALTQDGRVWAWGDNGDGQLGAPSSDSCRMANGLNRPCSRRPILVGTLPADVKGIAAGSRHSLALAAPLPPP
jgi:alpha-tubulin suppressor-like RCC1 family protein